MNTYDYYTHFELYTGSNVTSVKEMHGVFSTVTKLNSDEPEDLLILENIITRHIHKKTGDNFIKVKLCEFGVVH